MITPLSDKSFLPQTVFFCRVLTEKEYVFIICRFRSTCDCPHNSIRPNKTIQWITVSSEINVIFFFWTVNNLIIAIFFTFITYTVRCSVQAEEGDNAYHTACTPKLGVGSLGVDACALVEGAFHALDVVHTCADDAGLHNMTPAWENKSMVGVQVVDMPL